MKILYVEDEPIISMSVCDDLEDSGYEVIVVTRCDKALDMLANHSDVALLVTDVSTPGDMNGWELAEKVREAYPLLPIVYTTAFHNQDRVVSNSRFLGKPFTGKNLDQAITELV